MRIDVLALDGVFDLGLAAILDTLQTANELIEAGGLRVAPFRTRVVSVRRRVTTAQGLRVATLPASGRSPDCIVVPALGVKMPGPLELALGRADVRDAGALLRRAAARGTLVTASCVGTFVLAESGLLDGRRATTTWWLAAFFRQRYPRVTLDETEMIVPSGPVVTAGAALGHVDLALWLVRRSSPELAATTARYLIADARPSQAAYALVDHLNHDDPIVRRFEAWARKRLHERFSLDAAARAVGASKRTLARHTERVVGKSPLAYVQDLRVELAAHLLRTTPASVEQVAARVGYADGASLRALLRRRLRQGIREIRRTA